MANAPMAAKFGALADPTRLAIFQIVARRPSAVVDIAERVDVTRSAVSQHLKVLKDARLVAMERDGTRNIYRIDPRGVGAMRNWLKTYWTDALSEFAAFVEDNKE